MTLLKHTVLTAFSKFLASLQQQQHYDLLDLHFMIMIFTKMKNVYDNGK